MCCLLISKQHTGEIIVNNSFVNALKTCLSEQVSHPINQLIGKSYDTENGKFST